jgi:hypothetical protein
MRNEERIETAKQAVFDALCSNLCMPIADRAILTMQVVGSTYISDRTDSDVDLLCWHKSFDIASMTFSGWLYGGSAGLCPDNEKWMSWKREVNGVTVNMLLTNDPEYAAKWLTAAEVCRYLHLKDQGLKTCDVHGVHEIIMDDSTAEDEVKRRNY